MIETVTPKVYLIAKSNIELVAMEEFITDEGVNQDIDLRDKNAASYLCEIAGRLCYMSYGKGRKTNAEYIEHILSSKHGSVLEHANFTFIITGVSRSLTHELVRHRHLSFSQLSQRYVDESEAKFVKPAVVTDKYWEDTVGIAQATYKRIVDELAKIAPTFPASPPTEARKWARQAARSVMPNATETKICVTGNARAWRNFCHTRGSKHADPEIRQVAIMLMEELKVASPAIFGDMRVENGEIDSEYGVV